MFSLRVIFVRSLHIYKSFFKNSVTFNHDQISLYGKKNNIEMFSSALVLETKEKI